MRRKLSLPGQGRMAGAKQARRRATNQGDPDPTAAASPRGREPKGDEKRRAKRGEKPSPPRPPRAKTGKRKAEGTGAARQQGGIYVDVGRTVCGDRSLLDEHGRLPPLPVPEMRWKRTVKNKSAGPLPRPARRSLLRHAIQHHARDLIQMPLLTSWSDHMVTYKCPCMETSRTKQVFRAPLADPAQALQGPRLFERDGRTLSERKCQ
jgi:hypothetical protein